uniref:Uncharacterized protein n=1 Tax=Arundo donax TaxID=35708 RepID=A0A0A9A942_ARUDO
MSIDIFFNFMHGFSADIKLFYYRYQIIEEEYLIWFDPIS